MNAVDEFEKVVFLLKDWAKWQSGYSPNIGYPVRVPMLATGGGSSTFEELLDHVDNQAMKAVDASVESLPPSQRAAINRCYGLCAVWRFPRANYTYEQALSDGHDTLMVSFKRKGIFS